MQNSFKLIYQTFARVRTSRAPIFDLLANDAVIEYFSGRTTENETIKLMLELGQNLHIIPKDRRMDKFWARGIRC